MSKNVFAVFEQNDDSDDDKKVDAPKKLTKKEARVEDKVKREHYGDNVVKDENAPKAHYDGPKNKGDYAPGEKRPYERHSGTGKPAFTNDYKKGGFGKGNVGRPEREGDIVLGKKEGDLDTEDKKSPEKAQPVPEPKEEIMTLDEYMKNSGLNLQFINQKEEAVAQKVNITDKTVKLVQPKVKDSVEYSKKNAKNKDTMVVLNSNPLLEQAESTNDSRRKVSKRNVKTDFNEQNFPALS